MSPYATHLAHARLDALRQLVAALNEAESPDEKRRCAVAIFNAPDPCDLDDEIELESDDDTNDEDADIENERAPSFREPVESPSPATSPITSHPAVSVQSTPSIPSPHTHEIADRSTDPIDDLHHPQDFVAPSYTNLTTDQLLAPTTAAPHQLHALAHPA